MAPEKIESDIVVESAAGSPESAVETSAPPPQAGTEAPLSPEDQHDLDHEHDDEDDDSQDDAPKADASEAARTLASNRLSSRRARLTEDASALERTLRRLGAVVPVKGVRTYKNPQEEIDHLSRHRHDLTRALHNALENGAVPITPKPAAAPVVAKPEAKAVEEAEFKFDGWDKYQDDHPDADYTEYIEKRQDARLAFIEAKKETERKKTADAEANAASERTYRAAVDAHKGHVDEFKTTHADYDTVTKSIAINEAHPSYLAMQHAVLRAGSEGPSILYYLAQHPDEVVALQSTNGMGEFAELFGAVKYAARQTFPAGNGNGTPRAAALPKPSAPSPVTPVTGGARTTRSLRDLAQSDKEEDTDLYVMGRRKERERAGRR